MDEFKKYDLDNSGTIQISIEIGTVKKKKTNLKAESFQIF